MKLAIGIPNTGTIKSHTAFCLCRALKDFPYEYDVLFKEGSILHWNRESLAKKAIELGATHLLYLDADMSFDKDAIVRLIKRNKDIIGGAYNLRRLPSVTTVKSDKPLGKGKLVTCDAVGTGFMLVKTDVFKKLSHPWFFWESDDKGEVLTGEDYWFCRKARQAGYKVWVDLSIKLGHIGDFSY